VRTGENPAELQIEEASSLPRLTTVNTSLDLSVYRVKCVEIEKSSTSDGQEEIAEEAPQTSTYAEVCRDGIVCTTPPFSPSSHSLEPVTPEGRIRFSWRKLWAFTGPGLIMSVAFLDPGNLESDLQTGSETGYDLLWVLAWSTMLGLCFQLLAVRIGVVTGLSLAEVCHTCMPKHMRIMMWLLIEVAIIGSSVQEVLGCAIAIKILSNGAVPLWVGSLLTASDSFLFLLLEGAGIRYLEAFFGFLIVIMAVTFGVLFGQAQPPADEILRGIFVPELSASTMAVAVGLVGSICMPHNVFLHSALVQSRKINRASDHRVREANMYFTIESTVSLLVSFVVNMFVVTVFAKDFRNTTGGNEIGISDASEYISSMYPGSIKYIWGLGLLAAGQSSTMTGTYAGQFVMQGFLKLSLKPWQRVILTRCVALVPAVGLAIYTNSNTELNQSSDWLNVLQSIQLPFAMLPCIILSSSPKLMGVHASSRLTHAFTWLLLLVIMAGNMYLCLAFAQKLLDGQALKSALFWALNAAYFSLVAYIALHLEGHCENAVALQIQAAIKRVWALGTNRRPEQDELKQPLVRSSSDS